MCGRYTLTLEAEAFEAAYGLPAPVGWQPRYNIAPSQAAPVIANTADRQAALFRWGLIPGWATDPKIGQRLINARAETLAEKPSFRVALKKRRCLVLADGFYEWKRDGKQKTPMYLRLKANRPFALAGLWETWLSADQNETVHSYTIITTTPNALLSSIHDRMPVILPPTAYDVWLTPDDLATETALALLKPFPTAKMKALEVTPLVNSPAIDEPGCIRPAPPPPEPLL
jgi:putative SOS response-associated peptidase YedK